jgi:hypothetical protein
MRLLVSGTQRIFLIDAERHDVQVLKAIPDSGVYGLSWFHDGQALCYGEIPMIGVMSLRECIDSE